MSSVTTPRRSSSAWSWFAAAVPCGVLGVFFVYPVLAILWRGLGAAPERLVTVVSDGLLWRIGWFTLWQALASTALTLVIAAPMTWAVARFQFRGRALVRAVITIPFVLPTVVVAGAFIAAMNRFGLDGLRHTVPIVLAAHVFFNIAVIVRTVGGFWAGLDRRPEDAAQVLGATPARAFMEVTIVRLRPAILAALSIVFLFTFTSFGLILLLGGPRMQTIETEIYRYAINRIDFETAAALGTVQLAAVSALVWLNLRLERQRAGSGRGRERFAADHARSVRTPGERLAVLLACGATLGFVLAPIAALVETAFRRNGSFTLANFSELTERPPLLTIPPVDAIGNSLLFATAATGIAVVTGGLAALVIVHGRRAFGRILDLGVLLPVGTSAVTLGFGMLIALDEPPLDLRQSWWIIPIAQALIGLPFVVRAVVPVLRSVDDRLREAAAVLGASPVRIPREIDLPLASRALATGAGFAFAISLGEFGATLVLGRRGDLLTLPLAIERLLSQPGEALRSQAMALAVILMVMTTIVMMIVDRRGHGGVL